MESQQNKLLSALPAADYERLSPQIELIKMPLGQVLYEPGDELHYAYFPMSSIVSLLSEMENGASGEVAVIGNEGLVGISIFMGGIVSRSNRAIVLNAGYGFSMRASDLLEEFHRNGALSRLVLRYTQALITQMAQTAVCNRHHSMDQQLCRWLLLRLDRLPGCEVAMTQELIANTLGVRRETVSQAAVHLQHAGLIEYHRGHLKVLNRPGLEARVCECYGAVKTEVERLFS